MIQAVHGWNSGNILRLCNLVICMVALPVGFLINYSVFFLESVKTVCRKKSRGDGRALWPKTRAKTECGCFFVFCKSVKRHNIITGLQVKLTPCAQQACTEKTPPGLRNQTQDNTRRTLSSWTKALKKTSTQIQESNQRPTGSTPSRVREPTQDL